MSCRHKYWSLHQWICGPNRVSTLSLLSSKVYFYVFKSQYLCCLWFNFHNFYYIMISILSFTMKCFPFFSNAFTFLFSWNNFLEFNCFLFHVFPETLKLVITFNLCLGMETSKTGKGSGFLQNIMQKVFVEYSQSHYDKSKWIMSICILTWVIRHCTQAKKQNQRLSCHRQGDWAWLVDINYQGHLYTEGKAMCQA